MRNFEVFKGRWQNTAAIGARVTLSRQGAFYFNRRALELLGNPEAVIYLYDADARAVGFAPASAETPYAFPLSSQRATGKAYATARQFCRHYRINNPDSISCRAELEQGRLVIELDKGVNVSRRRKQA